ncbi:MAG TPA: transcription termination/antitermination factor NusG, partial [Firmicutes bacterium]|nr:transcription termination/antitermination factor NusG [Bacillota bacterium]
DKVAKLINETVKSKGLESEILNAIVPKVEKPEKNKKGEKKLVLKKVYPGYVLLRMQMGDENWNFIRNINNVIDFVGEKYQPTPISQEEWEEIFMGKKKRKREEIKVKFSVNEKVKITDGPFANFFGDISEINEEKKHVKVMISIFGRLTPVELSYEEVEKI